ncbi:MAG TPA: hypothetical protein VGI46_10705 [Candidatus Acidoferrum sp.]
MYRFLAFALLAASVFAAHTPAQISSSGIEPIRVPAGTTLAFHLQTRLRHNTSDPLDALPQGTVFHVKMLNPVDSSADRDGAEFHGVVVSDLSLGDDVLIHADSEVIGILVLLRSKNHPDGFRYELLLTELIDHGKSYPLTASLNTSFYDAASQPSPAPSPAAMPMKAEEKELPKPGAPANTKLAVVQPQ